MDTVHFNSPVAPGNQTWLHCEVEKIETAGITISVQTGYTRYRHFYPMHLIQKVEYGNNRR